MHKTLMLAVAAVAAAGLLGGCVADESAPTGPSDQAGLLPSSEKSRENAERRELEKPQRQLPTDGTGLPGQSRLDVPASGVPVVTLATLGDEPNQPVVPPLRDDQPYITKENRPLAVPGTDWVLESYVGQPAALEAYPRRPWPRTEAEYFSGTVAHNPVYLTPLYFQPPVVDRPADASEGARILKDWEDAPYFAAQLFVLPGLMVLQPPLAQQSTQWKVAPPVYVGHLPAAGEVAPAPVAGRIEWEYPFTQAQEQRLEQAHNPPLPVLPGTDGGQ